MINLICPNCKEEIVDSKLAFCVMCGFKLKGAKQPGFFSKSPETGVSKADEYASQTKKEAAKAPASQPAPAPQPVPAPQPAPQSVAQPPMQGTAAPQGMMQQQMPQGMAQPPMQGMAAPQGMMQQQMPHGMAQPPMQGMAAPQGMMQQQMPQGMAQPPMQGMMPQAEGAEAQQNPQMMGMMQPQMMGMQPMMGMPQFMGYDPNGNPIYVQMVPQMMGYDAYGNPMYTMMPMQSYGMPQMQGMAAPQGMMQQMPQGMVQPQMQGMMPQQGMPQMAAPPVQAAPVPQQAAPVPTPAPAPAQETQVRSTSYYSEMPISAEALMNEDENAEPPAPPAMMPNEEELLDQIFSDRPKQHSVSGKSVASAQTFSISLSANEITRLGEDEPAPAAPEQPKPEKPKKTEKPEKPVKTEKKAAAKPEKKPIKVISPDEFFDDKPRRNQKMVGVRVVEELDDEEMQEQLDSMKNGKKKSRRSMEAADRTMDAEAALENPAVEAAAQAILDEESALGAMDAMQQRFKELQKNVSVQNVDVAQSIAQEAEV